MANKITIVRGVSYPMSYQHQDTAGVAVPLTGKTLYFTVKEDEFDDSATDTSAIIQKTVSSHTNPATGLSEWTLTDADTYQDPGTYYFDVVIEDDTTKLSEPPSLYGKFIIKGTPSNRQVGNE